MILEIVSKLNHLSKQTESVPTPRKPTLVCKKCFQIIWNVHLLIAWDEWAIRNTSLWTAELWQNALNVNIHVSKVCHSKKSYLENISSEMKRTQEICCNKSKTQCKPLTVLFHSGMREPCLLFLLSLCVNRDLGKSRKKACLDLCDTVNRIH